MATDLKRHAPLHFLRIYNLSEVLDDQASLGDVYGRSEAPTHVLLANALCLRIRSLLEEAIAAVAMA